MLTLVDHESLTAEMEETTRGITDWIMASADYGRRDRLWPAHFMVFGTNAMNVAYGASGVALALHRMLGEVPAPVRDWMLDQPLDTRAYPPGLYVGLSGVAWTFLEIGLPEKAEEVMRLAYESPLLFAESNLFVGAAGWGTASLRFHEATGKQEYLDHAVRAGEHLAASAEHEGEGSFWKYHVENGVHFGYAYGASGIGLFLLRLGLRAGREDFVELARRAVEYELANRSEGPHGVQWMRYPNDMIALPYWLYGSAGVGTVLLRFHHALGDERYAAWAAQIAEAATIKWSVLPCLLEGLSGIGDYLLDMHRFTGDPVWRERALDMAETVLWYKIEKPEGIAFPCRWLQRIANDYATGSAGIGLFLHRALHGGSRPLVDLDDAPPYLP